MNMVFDLGFSSRARFGVYIPRDLLVELDELVKTARVGSRSRVVQEALRLFITEHKWIIGGSVAGSLCVLYNHEVKGVDEELTDAQHEFMDIVVSSMHVHLDRETCMLIIAVRGESSRVRDLLNRLTSIRGVLLVRPVLLKSG